MNRSRYDSINKKCLDCDTLMPDTERDISDHVCNPHHIEEKLKQLFGPKEPKIKQKFFKGQEVEGTLIGEIDTIIITRNGNIMYRITDDVKNVHGYFLQDQVKELLKPEDLHEPMEQKITEEER